MILITWWSNQFCVVILVQPLLPTHTSRTWKNLFLCHATLYRCSRATAAKSLSAFLLQSLIAKVYNIDIKKNPKPFLADTWWAFSLRRPIIFTGNFYFLWIENLKSYLLSKELLKVGIEPGTRTTNLNHSREKKNNKEMPCLTASSADEGNPVRHPTEAFAPPPSPHGIDQPHRYWRICTLTNVRRRYANKNPWKHPEEVVSMSAFYVKPSVLSLINIMRCFNVRIRDAIQAGNDRFKSHRWKHKIRGRKQAGEPREGQLGWEKAKATLHASSQPW